CLVTATVSSLKSSRAIGARRSATPACTSPTVATRRPMGRTIFLPLFPSITKSPTGWPALRPSAVRTEGSIPTGRSTVAQAGAPRLHVWGTFSPPGATLGIKVSKDPALGAGAPAHTVSVPARQIHTANSLSTAGFPVAAAQVGANGFVAFIDDAALVAAPPQD